MEYQIDNIYVKRFIYFNIYVIRGKTGDILIDTGFIGMRRELRKWLDNFNIKLVILTHAHVDHIWNTAYIKNRYGCQVAISENDIVNIDNRNINSKPSDEKYIRWTKLMNFGMRKFVPKPFDVDILLRDNKVIRRYGIDLKITTLSGHTNGSIGVIYKNYLFAGDALVNRKRKPQIAFQNQDNEEAINTYKKILNLSPSIIFVGHDREIDIRELEEVSITK